MLKETEDMSEETKQQIRRANAMANALNERHKAMREEGLIK